MIYRLGPTRLVRALVAATWVLILFLVATEFRPDLLHPADFGSDTSNYAAAGERLIGGDLYRLAPGDRPVPADHPPDWSVPILSPPPVATLWAVLALLPDPLRFHLPWMSGLAATTALALFLIARARILPLLAAAYVFFAGLGVMAWSGNVNALIAPGIAAVWLLTARPGSRWADIAAGVIVGSAAVVKLGPAMLALWLLAQRRWAALAACCAVVGAMLGVTLLLAGPSVFIDYLGVVRDAAAAPSPLSIPGLAMSLGAPTEGSGLYLVAVMTAAALVIVLGRSRSRITFAVAVVASVLATTVVRFDSLVVVVAALTPWCLTVTPSTPSKRRLMVPTAIAVGAGLIAVTCGLTAVATGGVARSSLTIGNDLPSPVVVRVGVPGQSASFGFQVTRGATGTAWSDQMGRLTREIFVFTPSCDLLHRISASGIGSSIRITSTGVATGEAAQATPGYLSYSAACAVQARRLLAPLTTP